MLAKGVEAGFEGITGDFGGDRGLRAGVGRRTVGGRGDGSVVGVGFVVGAVVVEEGRELQDGGWVEGVQPGGGDDAVGLVLGVAKAAGVVLLVFEAAGVGIVGDLEEVTAELGDEAKLIFGGAIVDQRREAAVAVGGVVEDPADGRGEAVVRCGCR